MEPASSVGGRCQTRAGWPPSRPDRPTYLHWPQRPLEFFHSPSSLDKIIYMKGREGENTERCPVSNSQAWPMSPSWVAGVQVLGPSSSTAIPRHWPKVTPVHFLLQLLALPFLFSNCPEFVPLESWDVALNSLPSCGRCFFLLLCVRVCAASQQRSLWQETLPREASFCFNDNAGLRRGRPH